MTTPLLPLIGQGISADIAAGHTIVPGVVRQRYALDVRRGETPRYDVEIAAEGGRAHLLRGITGAVYCQRGHTVWVGLPYGDPHRGATILSRQLPGLPQRYVLADGLASAIPYLGHPQIYHIYAVCIVTDPTTWSDALRLWDQPHVDLTLSLRMEASPGGSVTTVWYRDRVQLRGTRRPDIEVSTPLNNPTPATLPGGAHLHTANVTGRTGSRDGHSHSVTASGPTTEAPDHVHPLSNPNHSHPNSPEYVAGGYDGPFAATVRADGIIRAADYILSPQFSADGASISIIDPTISVTPIVTAESETGATYPSMLAVELRGVQITEIGVYSG